jgi:hypothetical protein
MVQIQLKVTTKKAVAFAEQRAALRQLYSCAQPWSNAGKTVFAQEFWHN